MLFEPPLESPLDSPLEPPLEPPGPGSMGCPANLTRQVIRHRGLLASREVLAGAMSEPLLARLLHLPITTRARVALTAPNATTPGDTSGDTFPSTRPFSRNRMEPMRRSKEFVNEVTLRNHTLDWFHEAEPSAHFQAARESSNSKIIFMKRPGPSALSLPPPLFVTPEPPPMPTKPSDLAKFLTARPRGSHYKSHDKSHDKGVALVGEGDGRWVALVAGSPAADQVLAPWAACAAREECVCPPPRPDEGPPLSIAMLRLFAARGRFALRND